MTYHGRSFQVQGQSWMDHEFSSSQLAQYQTGWDWFSLQLDDGHDLMLYVLRHQDGSPDPFSSGTLVDPVGQGRHLKLADFSIQVLNTWKSPRSGAVYPAAWKLSLPEQGYNWNCTPPSRTRSWSRPKAPGLPTGKAASRSPADAMANR